MILRNNSGKFSINPTMHFSLLFVLCLSVTNCYYYYYFLLDFLPIYEATMVQVHGTYTT